VTSQTASRRLRRLPSCALLSAVLLTGCGSLQPHSDIVRAAGGAAGDSSTALGATTGDQGSTTGTDGSATGSSGSSVLPGTGSSGTTGTSGTTSGTTSGGATSGTSGTTSGTGTGGSTTGGAADHGVVTIGNVSTTSGVAGGAQRPGVVGLQAWVAATNAAGGVKLIARDDQNDPNQNASYTQALVEQAHVQAFVSNWASQTQAASADYLKAKQIPVVGGDHTGDNSWGVNPMFFPTAAIGQDAVRNSMSALAHVAIPQGKKKLAILVCVEGGICTTGQKTANEIAPKLGFNTVYNGSASFAAPSYTAECLNMKNAGAEAVATIFPASSNKNIARDCGRQGLKVIYSLGFGTMEGDFNKDPNFDGASVNNAVFPWAATDTPVERMYQAAMKKYAPTQLSNPASAAGFAAGVVFGAALAKVQGPVTSAKLIAALRTFKNETFGGTTIPLTYKNGPMVPPACYFLSVISHGEYVTRNGGKYLCVTVR